MEYTIQRISLAQISDLLFLFDAYRIFYRQESDRQRAIQFLTERLKREESVIFVAYIDNEAVGFTQLYYTFSSVSLERSLILNDLYVSTLHRNKNIGKSLLLTAQKFCRTNGYKGLALETATDNPAQRLYEQLGWQKDSHCFHYFWTAN